MNIIRFSLLSSLYASDNEESKKVIAQSVKECLTDLIGGVSYKANEAKDLGLISFDYDLPQQSIKIHNPFLKSKNLANRCIAQQMGVDSSEQNLKREMAANAFACIMENNSKKLCSQYVKCVDGTFRFTVCDCKYKAQGDIGVASCLTDDSLARVEYDSKDKENRTTFEVKSKNTTKQ